MDPLFLHVKRLNLPIGDYAIFGSGPLIVRGVIAASNDLDIICRGAAWEQAKSIGTIEFLEEYNVTIATICAGRISFGTQWGIGAFDIDDLIDEADQINGLPFVRLRHVISYKQIRDTPKDKSHLKALMGGEYEIS